jgi:acetyltransferase-like isoleucine patch superfamily enzyme
VDFVSNLKNGLLEFIRKAKVLVDIATLPDFSSKSANLKFESPRKITNPSQIKIGKNVRIGQNSTLNAINHKTENRDVRIIIGDNVEATSSLQIHSMNKIIIESDVLFAANIFIVDGSHGYLSAEIPYKDQGFINISTVKIGKGCWIGQNVVILQGVTIGEYCIVGANSVVSRSIPDKCIAVGSPARPIKRWNEQLKIWEKY